MLVTQNFAIFATVLNFNFTFLLIMHVITENASLLKHNTFGMDVKARYLGEYDTIRDLQMILSDPRVKDLPFLHIGQGSNLLFTQDYPGLILHSLAKGVRVVDEVSRVSRKGKHIEASIVEIEAGTVWDDVCAWAVEQGLYGIENLSGIPGEAGAAAVQNIGAYGSEIGDRVRAVVVIDLYTNQIMALDQKQMRYGYRNSFLKKPENKQRYIVIKVYLELFRTEGWNLTYQGLRDALYKVCPNMTEENPDTSYLTLGLVRDVVIGLRNSKLPDPKVLGNAGSFFKNPHIPIEQCNALKAKYETMPTYPYEKKEMKIPAGWLIDNCGWKGKSIGRAGVYEKQALVLVNLGDATPDEICHLSDVVTADVAEKFGIVLEPEVNFI